MAVPDILLTALRPGPTASGAAVASSLARSLSPPECPVPAPTWLLPRQVRSFRRVLAAVRRYGGALLADPVGSGKTYVALAVAAAVNRRSTACLVPAALTAQWQTIADRLSIPVGLCSHEQISRGRLPSGTRGLVLIDESHHFRNPETQRYRYLAPWMVGRPALLVSATPVVNRTQDMLHQLLLAVRDDALALHGVSSLLAMLRDRRAHPALGHLVFQQTAGLQRPGRLYASSTASQEERSTMSRCIAQLNQLRLSRSEPVAALIRGVLLRAMASSPAAYISALRRYRSLLLHARDAEQAGHRLDRAALRRFTADLRDQLVLWELFSSTDAHTDMELDDLDTLPNLLSQAADLAVAEDGKVERLRRLLDDGIPTLVFTGSRDTVGYLRRQLRELGIAWCTGERAGIDGSALPRKMVWNWFRKPTASPHAPRHLVVTDVAAEGLDLPRAARVIHYDLPWTPMRLEQREGRSARYGSSHTAVQVVQFRLPPNLEQLLQIEATLARKHGIPAMAGLGSEGRQIWRWRSELADRYDSGQAQEGLANVSSEGRGVLAGFTVYAPGDPENYAATVVWIEANGSWTESPEVVEACLEVAAREHRVATISADQVSHSLCLLAEPIRSRLALRRSCRWITHKPVGGAKTLLSRLQLGLKDAARRRDGSALAELERAIAFVAGGHTAGEMVLLEQLARVSDSELLRRLSTMPRRAAGSEELEVRINGLIVFGPAESAPARVASSECPSFGPPSSTSMER